MAAEYREGVTSNQALEVRRNTLLLLAVLERNSEMLAELIEDDRATEDEILGLVHEQGRNYRVWVRLKEDFEKDYGVPYSPDHEEKYRMLNSWVRLRTEE